MIISRKGKTLDLTIQAPPSKSVYHRELIVRFLSGDSKCLADDTGDNNDIKATKACLRALDEARQEQKNEVILPCKESGSTIRFLIPVAAAFLLGENRCSEKLVFRTEGRLFERPFGELAEAMSPHGIVIDKDSASRSIIVTGSMTPGKYVIDGSVSSQYISGLLMALPLFSEESSIEVTGEMKSVGYIDLTLDALSKYDTPAKKNGNVFVPSFGGYKGDVSGDFKVEGDWSNGAFLLCMAEWSNIKVEGLNPGSRQGDRAITDFLEYANQTPAAADPSWDCTDTPDIAPYMAIVAPFFFGKITLKGIGRLRIKESDRVKAVREQLAAIGVRTEETEDTLTVYEYDAPAQGLESPIKLSSYHDHRMAMCAVLIAVILKEDVEIDDVDCLKKSFPEFLDVIEKEFTKA